MKHLHTHTQGTARYDDTDCTTKHQEQHGGTARRGQHAGSISLCKLRRLYIDIHLLSLSSLPHSPSLLPLRSRDSENSP